ncbi:hypothetical protein [Tenacibaculum sp. M341]|uniref:hypothetical protein n=1 Tax=Tenacibaculum sp. M341 TaxID=2530339 RepID=UPI00104CA8D6|nr:hypothetical protein [Tenacibaculum sp. M341]TCI85394.1 hypothetical protein EYW44_16715 [Tenacibaculum sp. M341]
MRKLFNTILIVSISILFVQCGKDKYTISKGKVGELTTETTIEQLDKIFAKDSIVKILSEGAKGNYSFQDEDEYQIYEKGGKHLLTIVPKQELDSTSTIKSIEIFDERYATESGLNIKSSFREINANNAISKIETSFKSATIFIDDLNATISIDKEQLGLADFSMQKVSIEQIPDLAKVKSFIVWFN